MRFMTTPFHALWPRPSDLRSWRATEEETQTTHQPSSRSKRLKAKQVMFLKIK